MTIHVNPKSADYWACDITTISHVTIENDRSAHYWRGDTIRVVSASIAINQVVLTKTHKIY